MIMLEIFLMPLNSVGSIVIIMAIGYYLKKKNYLDDRFYKTASKLIFNLCLPVYLFCNIYNVKSFGEINFNIVWYAIAAIVVVFFLGLLIVIFFVNDNKQKGVVLHSIFRSNFALLGVSVAETLGGSEALANVGILSAFTMPLFSILGLLSLEIFSREKRSGIQVKDMVIEIIKNPLVRAVMCSLAVLLIRKLVPSDENGQLLLSFSRNLPFIYQAFEKIGKISSPLALLIMGSQFKFKIEDRKRKFLIIGVLGKVILMPLVAIGGEVFLMNHVSYINFNNSDFAAYLALFASPTAVSTVVMAEEMGGDSDLAVQLVTWTSIASIITFYIIILILKSQKLL